MKLQFLMRQGIRIVLISAALAGTAAADEARIRRTLGELLPGVPVREVNPSPIAGLFEVVLNGFNVIYTDATGELAIQGNLIRLNGGASLTAKRVEALQRVEFASLPLDRAIKKVKGDGSRTLAVFADPDCPYCRQLERELQAIDNVTIYTFLLPLPDLHPDALRKAKQVWCSADRVKAWDALMLDGVEPTAGADCETPVEAVAALAAEHYINGTPGIVFANGKLVPGAPARQKLEAMLNEFGRL